MSEARDGTPERASIPMCLPCWEERYAPRAPKMMREPEKERCFYCSKATEAGIYVLDDRKRIERETLAARIFCFRTNVPGTRDDLRWRVRVAIDQSVTSRFIPVRVDVAKPFVVEQVVVGCEPCHVDNRGVLRPQVEYCSGMDLELVVRGGEPKQPVEFEVFGIDFGSTPDEVAQANKPKAAHAINCPIVSDVPKASRD